jgi:hypothetical protein
LDHKNSLEENYNARMSHGYLVFADDLSSKLFFDIVKIDISDKSIRPPPAQYFDEDKRASITKLDNNILIFEKHPDRERDLIRFPHKVISIFAERLREYGKQSKI